MRRILGRVVGVGLSLALWLISSPAQAALPARAAPVSLWSYAWGLAAVEDLARLPGGRTWRAEIPHLVAGLAPYWDAGAPTPAYAPYPDPTPETVKFYDDNAWVGLDLVTAWQLTHRPQYLQRAEALFRYEETGWDPHGGGLFWNDRHLLRNTAANAPAAELAAELYSVTRRPQYLRWAMRLKAWEQRHLVNPKTGAVWDHLGRGATVDRHLLSYNQGAVIGADCALYRATHERAYLEAAAKTAAFVAHHWTAFDGHRPLATAFAGVLADDLVWLWRLGHVPAARLALEQLSPPTAALPGRWANPVLLAASGRIRLVADQAAVSAPPPPPDRSPAP
ncbi:MAG: glycoside hydrolase family 76 protein [Firmicutes bacterium]|nr:AGE family epimerase/isomerase [Alicyclobacillaceae bacterium]MCL6496047.1 glycoside hydrolase family 76 protein [Bacillota bacterium]